MASCSHPFPTTELAGHQGISTDKRGQPDDTQVNPTTYLHLFGAHGELKLESQRPRIPLWIKILLLAMLNLAILGTVFAAFLRSQLKPELESFLMAEAREGYDVEDVARLHHADAASGRINKYNPRHHSLQGKGFISSPSFESFRQLRFQ